MAYGLSKLHQSTEIVDNNGATQGTIVHSGDLATKQDTLVSGTNIKTINSTSLLGSGNISISGGGGLTSVKGWTGILTVSGSSTSATVTGLSEGDLIAVELSTASETNAPTKLVYARLGLYDTSLDFNYGVTVSSSLILYHSYSEVYLNNSTTLVFVLPYYTYQSIVYSSPSATSANAAQDTLYLHNVYLVEEA